MNGVAMADRQVFDLAIIGGRISGAAAVQAGLRM